MTLQNLEEDASAKAKAIEPRGQRLKGQIVVITGGDSGIGQATAVACAMEGADVAVSYHTDEDGAQSTLDEVTRAKRRGTIYRLDQADPDQVEGFFEHVRHELGTPTILVNNAGVDAGGRQVKEMDVGDWEREIAVNLNGPFYCTRAYLRAFLDEHGSVSEEEPVEEPIGWTRGVIINITSVHDRIPRAGASSYDAAKGGLKNLTRTLALELGTERIRVVNVAPGMVLTPFNEPARQDPGKRKKQIESIPVKRAALPSEIARTVVFLASDDASYIHGTTIYVDGGLKQFQGQGA